MNTETSILQALQFHGVNGATMQAVQNLIRGAQATLVAIDCGGHQKAVEKSNPLSVSFLRNALAECGESPKVGRQVRGGK